MCDPGLQSHTTTKTMEEFLLHAVTALVRDGALSICDGADPDGTLVISEVVNIRDEEMMEIEEFVKGGSLKFFLLHYTPIRCIIL